MIAQLKGIIDFLEKGGVIIDVNGVGYLVGVSMRTQEALSLGQPATLRIETISKQDHISLYGFATLEEQACFRLLITVQGVGPKVGLALLSAFSPDKIQSAISVQDATLLTQAEGVGPKLAQRIVRELKDKVLPLPSSSPSSAEDAISALLHLGYKRSQILEALRQLPENTPQDTQSLITASLRALS